MSLIGRYLCSLASSYSTPSSGPLHSSGPTDVAEALRCQYSSKRCENERTHKKSGGLHKFCAMHREKANRNQMRLDHRRRVLKQQQKELKRQRLAQQIQAQQQLNHWRSSATVATRRTLYPDTDRVQQQQLSPFDGTEPFSPPSTTMMAVTMHVPSPVASPLVEMQQPQVPPTESSPSALPLFDQRDLAILEAMLFSSDEETGDASPLAHCSAPRYDRSPSFVNV
ncbi:unnamed protein product [Hyaloperonospora brassicae]|uniref:SBP-type domain-containing protein n=1 Tax=Hyaloperonospora brassicae TaxID=162125 RepID=A0AAV0UQ11_HYABA|nr:unnamed protein product [Hyaloperonospora brassicae]